MAAASDNDPPMHTLNPITIQCMEAYLCLLILSPSPVPAYAGPLCLLMPGPLWLLMLAPCACLSWPPVPTYAGPLCLLMLAPCACLCWPPVPAYPGPLCLYPGPLWYCMQVGYEREPSPDTPGRGRGGGRGQQGLLFLRAGCG